MHSIATDAVPVFYFSVRPPDRRHGYEQHFHSITAQAENEALEVKRPRMETVAEAHMNRTTPIAGGIMMPMPHSVQDSLRATVEVKKVGLTSFLRHFGKCLVVILYQGNHNHLGVFILNFYS